MASRREVAEAAGVSIRTVSNVVSGHVHVSAPTRERVARAIRDLDYRPSELARWLRVGRSGLVGLVLPELDTPYFADLTRAFVEQGTERGLTVVIDQTDGDLERERHLIDRTHYGSLFDGLIISPLALTPAHLDRVGADRALVFLGELPMAGFDQVMIDNRAAARQAVEHLLATGRRRIAAVGAENHTHSSGRERLAGYCDALTAAGLPVEESLVVTVSAFRRAAGAEAVAALLDRGERPDAIFCFSDPLALGALRTLLTRGIDVPGDISIIGFDDIEDGRFSTPTLTSVSPDRRFIANAALDALESRALAPETPGRLIVAPHRLEVRESSTRT